MKQTLEELWNGHIRPCDSCGAGDAEIEELRIFIKRHREKLEQQLDEKQKHTFENYAGCFDEYLYLQVVHAFAEGFSLATKLAAEVQQ